MAALSAPATAPSAGAAAGRCQAAGSRTPSGRRAGPCPPPRRPIQPSRAEGPSRRRFGRTARPIGTCASFHSPASPRMLTTTNAGILYGMSSDVRALSELPRPLDWSITVGRAPPRYSPAGDAERLLFPRRQRGADVRHLAKDPEDMRQRVVRHIDDVAAAGGVQPRAHAGRPFGLRVIDCSLPAPASRSARSLQRPSPGKMRPCKRLPSPPGRPPSCSPRPRCPDGRPRPAASRRRLRGISAASDRVVWASGAGGTILRTADGGATWQKLTIPDAQRLDFRDIDAVSETSAYALSIGAGSGVPDLQDDRRRRTLAAAVHQRRSQGVLRRDGVLGRRPRPRDERFSGRALRDSDDPRRRTYVDARAGRRAAAGASQRRRVRGQRHQRRRARPRPRVDWHGRLHHVTRPAHDRRRPIVGGAPTRRSRRPRRPASSPWHFATRAMG